jgi:hypothetical protein
MRVDVLKTVQVMMMLVGVNKARSGRARSCLASQGPGKSVQELTALRAMVGADEMRCRLPEESFCGLYIEKR